VYLYVGSISILGVILLVSSITYMWSHPETVAWSLILGLGTMITDFLPIRSQRRGARYDLKPALLFAGALTLPPPCLPLISLIGHVPYALWGRPRLRYLEPAFNYTQCALAAMAAGLVHWAIAPGIHFVASLSDLLGVLAAILAFLLVQQILVTGVVMAQRKVGWREAGTFDLNNSLIDLLVLAVGSLVAQMYHVSLWAILVSLTPLCGLYLAMRLSQDRDSLKVADQAKNELIANVSHELRAPLASIKLYTELLQNNIENDDAEVRNEFSRVIDHQTVRLADLITDLLELSRLESGHVQPRLEPLPLRELIAHVTTGLATQANARQVEITTRLYPQNLHILTDRDLFHTALRNLVSNAIKFNRPGGLVKIIAQGGPPGLVEIQVQDTGIGIPPATLPHIFDKFYRVQSSTDSGIEGSGLGLTVVKAAISLLGGQIDVSSTLGQGTCFVVRLPRVKAEDQS